MTKVYVWTMADDPLTGPIPKAMCNMQGMAILHLGGSSLTSIPDCLSFMATRNCGLEDIPFKCPIPSWAKQHCGATCS